VALIIQSLGVSRDVTVAGGLYIPGQNAMSREVFMQIIRRLITIVVLAGVLTGCAARSLSPWVWMWRYEELRRI
jgi:hypothetical protein